MSTTVVQTQATPNGANGTKPGETETHCDHADSAHESSKKKQLLPHTINPRVMEAQYAVRGALVLRAMQHQRALDSGEKMPFDEIIYCNIGNPHQLRQKPITYFRQVLSIVDYPELATLAPSAYPPDAVARALKFLDNCPGGTGAYSESQGISCIRQHVADFISKRDGVKASADDIFLSDGASQGVSIAMQILIRDSMDGVMIPIPQYPLYTATISLCGGRAVGYYLNEEANWTMEIAELRRSIREARQEGVRVRAMVVINPGNPTGQCLGIENMREVVRFCEEEGLLLIADEVYQVNTYGEDCNFVSFRRVVTELNSPIELLSYHSVSKGFVGECGRRGGYMELHNIHPEVFEQVYKMFSIGLCCNVSGQVMVDLMVKPPAEGEPSYELYEQEIAALRGSMTRRSKKLSAALNTMRNVSCTPIQGAMYAFPTIRLPAKAHAAAAQAGMAPDTFYCVSLLDATGICVVPGSGFRQKKGTWHFRTTFLPGEDKMDMVIDKLRRFNDTFMSTYED
mmetsp:Transcript_63335/g.169333  ORF Transcript_63335/g.169333 Transcript_63335/m.169333 type:complete len:513 (-) Transcript_63335:34-1572(-)|eukprot:CAMPEP_0113695328 /NCGR_PEP_ID=MMETSP0038_2-20120614/20837_1 /TAXON_ID=2898 /ORGANISM="Cryptomonas paramecium" /LENGTH=512 /DNA_ID=CAMNT_0000617855 /DNA_START=177 /DNA_END=1715 /DNA_ORIENTATION=+ /assembly_acc=CAM_ASM_000170